MKKFPQAITNRPELNLRLGIKSSLPDIDKAFAITISLYLACKEPAEIEYTKEVTVGTNTSIIIQSQLLNELQIFFANQIIINSSINFEKEVNKTPLFKAQMEALQVSFELFWKIGLFRFKAGLAASTERTGGSRYNKLIKYSTNAIILKEALSDSGGNINDEVKIVLFNWITGIPIPLEAGPLVKKIQKLLTIFSEETQFKIRTSSSNEIIFQQEGIYNEVLLGNTVEIRDYLEDVGPFRILKSFTSANLHTYLAAGREGFELRPGVLPDDLSNYYEKVNNFLNLIPKRTSIFLMEEREEVEENKENEVERITIFNTKIPRNKILYGAPGTGKSRKLDEDAANFKSKDINRTTFYPDYSYGQFVGSYKPVPYYKEATGNKIELFYEKLGGNKIAEREPAINYELVPGPFLVTLKNALLSVYNVKNSTGAGGVATTNTENTSQEGETSSDITRTGIDLSNEDNVQNHIESHLLIIEEINRANAAAVFGDVFQLLDRKTNGISEYQITFNADISNWLKQEISKEVTKEVIQILQPGNPDPVFEVSKKDGRVNVRLPGNMYIWATMNSADQGVMPLDTAFKRRWFMEYMALDNGDSIIGRWNNQNVEISKDSNKTLKEVHTIDELKDCYIITLFGKELLWDCFRKAVNSYLRDRNSNIPEDRMLGPFFMKKEELQDEEAVKNKLLLYLREDVARHQNIIFGPLNGKERHRPPTLSEIFNEYEELKLKDFNEAAKHFFDKDLAEGIIQCLNDYSNFKESLSKDKPPATN